MNLNLYYFINEYNKNEIEKLSSKISLIYRNYDNKKDSALKSIIEPAAVRKIPLLKLLFLDTIFNELNYFILEIYTNNRKRLFRRDG